MSIEQDINRIATALEGMLAYARGEGAPVQAPAVEQPKKTTRRMKDVAIPAQQAAADTVPGLEEVVSEAMDNVVLNAMADDQGVVMRTGAELRAAAQGYITAADKVGLTEKLVTFIQSVAKIYAPTEPKLIKIPDAKVPEAAVMIADWCRKNGIKV